MDSGDKNLAERLAKSLLLGERLFLTGAAGTGKTFMTRRIISNILKQMTIERTDSQCQVVVTASTGIAATQILSTRGELANGNLIGPMTLHSAACLPLDHHADSSRRLQQGKENFRNARVIVIDEISMLHHLTFDQFLERVPSNCGILVVGDFYQLEPVDRDNPEIPAYCFQSEHFFSCFRMVDLTVNHRQQDELFNEFLGRTRVGNLDWSTMLPFSTEFNEINPIIFGTNKEREGHNAKCMALLKSLPVRSTAVVEQDYEMKARSWFRNKCRAEESLLLKKGMRVICIQNQKLGSKYLVNGDIGTVVSIGEIDQEGCVLHVTVAFDRQGLGRLQVPAYRFEESHLQNGKEELVHRVRQIPLIAAYALTVHKSQGMTLESANIDGTKINFARGQAYVALSRCSTPNGLRIRHAACMRALTSPLVGDYYQRAPRYDYKPDDNPIIPSEGAAPVSRLQEPSHDSHRAQDREVESPNHAEYSATRSLNHTREFGLSGLAVAIALIVFGAGLMFVAYAIMQAK